MKYFELNIDEKEAVEDIIRIFKIEYLLTLGKKELGNNVCDLLNHMGYDGNKFVHHFYDISPERGNNPLSEINPKLYMLCSFIALLSKTSLRHHGRDMNDGDGFFELAIDLVELVEDNTL
jgi:hypothetical protein